MGFKNFLHDRAIQKIIKDWISKYADDNCQENGDYIPVDEDDEGNPKPIFEEKRFFKRGEPFTTINTE